MRTELTTRIATVFMPQDAALLDPGEVLKRYESPLVGVHHVRVAGDHHTTHSHDDVQFFVAFAGSSMQATWSGSSGNRRRFRFEDGQTLVVDSGQDHRFDWSFIDMVSAFASRSFIANVLGEAFPVLPAIGDVGCIDDAIVVRQAMRLARELRSAQPDPVAIESAVIAIITRVGERVAGRSARDAGLSRRDWDRLIAYVEDHLSEPLSLVRLAEAAGLPPYTLARAFRARCGIPPHRWILGRRLARAKSALVGSTSIATIAFDTGFAQQSHLTAAFRAENGITPARYRRLAAESSEF